MNSKEEKDDSTNSAFFERNIMIYEYELLHYMVWKYYYKLSTYL